MTKSTMLRNALAGAAIAALAIIPGHTDSMKNCAAAWDAKSAAEKSATTYKAFSSTCLKKGSSAGLTATSATSTPAGATGQCKDGTYTKSKSHSGACSKHGGVAKWLM